MSIGCPVCLAAEHGSDDSLGSLVRRQAVTIDRLRSNLDTFALVAAKGRIRELEELLERVNRSQPQRVAVQIAADLAQIDPRLNDGTLECFFCCQKGTHRKDCMWRRACVVAEIHERNERRSRAS